MLGRDVADNLPLDETQTEQNRYEATDSAQRPGADSSSSSAKIDRTISHLTLLITDLLLLQVLVVCRVSR